MRSQRGLILDARPDAGAASVVDSTASFASRQPACPPLLEELQRRMSAWIAPAALGAHPMSDEALETAASELLRGPVGASAAAAIAVYAGGYPARIHEALRETFEAVERVVSCEAFVALAQRYAAACPPRSWNRNDAGDALPSFLAGDELSSQFPFLPDLAELELRIAQSFHARWEEPADLSALAGWSPDEQAQALLSFQPSLFVVSSRWPLQALWRSVQSDDVAVDVDLSRGQHVMVWRQGLDVMIDEIEEAEASALAYLRSGSRLGPTIERLAELGADAGAVARWFSRWGGLGFIRNVCDHPHRRYQQLTRRSASGCGSET